MVRNHYSTKFDKLAMYGGHSGVQELRQRGKHQEGAVFLSSQLAADASAEAHRDDIFGEQLSSGNAG